MRLTWGATNSVTNCSEIARLKNLGNWLEIEMRLVRLGRNGPDVSEMGLGCMGIVVRLWSRRRCGVHRHHPCRARGRHHHARHRRLLRFGAQRDADQGGAQGLQARARLHRGQIRRDARPGPQIPRRRWPAEFGEELSRLHAAPPWHRPCRSLPAGAARSHGADRGYDRRHRRDGAGRLRSSRRALGSVKSIRRAHAVRPIAALQIEYSLASRGIEKEILPTIRELGIALVAYGVLSRGLISDSAPASQGAGEIRTRMPRFLAENFPHNMALVRALGAIAREKNASTAQLAFAWIRSRGGDVVPLIGARRRDQLKEALGSLDVSLTAADLARIAQAVPAEAVAGIRYLPAVLAHLDSEHAG